MTLTEAQASLDSNSLKISRLEALGRCRQWSLSFSVAVGFPNTVPTPLEHALPHDRENTISDSSCRRRTSLPIDAATVFGPSLPKLCSALLNQHPLLKSRFFQKVLFLDIVFPGRLDKQNLNKKEGKWVRKFSSRLKRAKSFIPASLIYSHR